MGLFGLFGLFVFTLSTAVAFSFPNRDAAKVAMGAALTLSHPRVRS